MTLKIKSWPVSSRCAKETGNPHRGSISGRCHSSTKILSLRPSSYAYAKGWNNLVNAFSESLKHSSLDEMILLVHTTIPGPYEQQLEYVRQVTYNTLDEIPQLLLSTAPGAPRTGTTPGHQERQHVEVETGIQPDDDEYGQAQQEHVEISQEWIHDGKEVEVVAAGRGHEEEIEETRVNAAKAMQDAYHRRLEQRRADGDHEEEIKETRVNAANTIQDAYRRRLEQGQASGDHEEEIEETRVNAANAIQDAYRRRLEQRRAGAAQKIQATYRRYLKRKSVVLQGTDATQAHYWHLLRKRSSEIGWSKDSRYYILFRFPLAYILVCLDVIKTFAESKKDTKEKMVAEGDKDLEELTEVFSKHRCVRALIAHFIGI